MTRGIIQEKPVQSLGTSASGAAWYIRDVSERDVMTAMQRHELPELVARLLVGREIPVDQMMDFLNPSLRYWLPDPLHLLDMEKAAKRVMQAIIQGEMIAVLGDYDVDGATSTALFLRYLTYVGASVTFHIPDRITEGYGPTVQAMEMLHARGARVCITVDCGTMAFEPLEHAASLGLDVIVVDHHLGAEHLPVAYAVVNPNRLDELSEHGYMAAVGVSFLFMVALQRMLQEHGFFNGKKPFDLFQLLDAVALGTVCDVVPLVKANRAYVAQGIKILRQRQHIGLNALMDIASLNEPPGTYHLGFVLGPRINAGGRVGKSDLGTRLLTSQDTNVTSDIARQLNHFNAERKAIEQQVLDEAMMQVEMQQGSSPSLVMAVGEGWHPGVIGIVAGRLKERYHRPTAVISMDKGVGKASARSITGVDFGGAVVAATQAGLLVSGGGHKMAAGFTVEATKVEPLRAFFNERFAAGVQAFGQKRLFADGYLSVGAITVDLITTLEKVGPFGMGHPEPCFIIPSVVIFKVDVLAGQHLRVIIGDTYAEGKGRTIKAMSFRSVGTPLGELLQTQRGKPLHMAVKLRINHWQGTSSPEVFIEDAMMA